MTSDEWDSSVSDTEDEEEVTVDDFLAQCSDAELADMRQSVKVD